MAKTVAMTGNAACAQAMRQIDPDVVAAYPITPQTTIVEEFSNFVAKGQVQTEYVTVESEHSAMSACIGASAAGSRVMTTTSSQGLALMWEMLYIASGLRLPIVMHNVNRTLSAPINIHCDHSDSMGARDSGWVQIFSEDAQEAYDNTIQAVRIAEHGDVHLPVMVLLDGFIVSHAIARLDLLEDDQVKKFVGDYVPAFQLLNPQHEVTIGSFDALHGNYFEFKRAQVEAFDNSKTVLQDVGREFAKLSGRHYGLFEPFMMDDAELAVVVSGSTAGTTRAVVKELRAQGTKAGLIKLRSFRPFPGPELVAALRDCKAVAVLDRATSLGAEGGPMYLEVRNSMYDMDGRLPVINYIYGLGGRDIGTELIEQVYADLAGLAGGKPGIEAVQYLGLKE
ncbi:MAG: pyruvate ferredoxin oxidoreductase [Actinobacteria bacterium]|nr:MAG: pyruvate ferredoxin oxidoreductase [Actinomycetota bacterium]